MGDRGGPGDQPGHAGAIGDVIEKNYAVNDSAGRHIIQISQKWIQIRDQYVIDIADAVEPAAALALVWAIDRWVERD